MKKHTSGRKALASASAAVGTAALAALLLATPAQAQRDPNPSFESGTSAQTTVPPATASDGGVQVGQMAAGAGLGLLLGAGLTSAASRARRRNSSPAVAAA